MLLFNGLMYLLLFSVPSSTSPVEKEEYECSPLHLVFLRGSKEKNHPGRVGNPFSKALASFVPGTTTYSVPYDSRFTFGASILKGAEMTVQYLTEQWVRCPHQHFVIGGYSKGAMVIHSMNLPHYLKTQVISVVVFGDPLHITARSWPIHYPVVNLTPKSGFSISQNVVSFCNHGDMICNGGVWAGSHLTYGEDGSVFIAAISVRDRMNALVKKYIA